MPHDAADCDLAAAAAAVSAGSCRVVQPQTDSEAAAWEMRLQDTAATEGLPIIPIMYLGHGIYQPLSAVDATNGEALAPSIAKDSLRWQLLVRAADATVSKGLAGSIDEDAYGVQDMVLMNGGLLAMGRGTAVSEFCRSS